VQLPYEEVIIGTGDPVEESNLVEFRLLYEGELLPSANTKRRAPEKHAIRRIFHPQLRRLWQVQPELKQFAGQAWFNSAGRMNLDSTKRMELERQETPFELGLKVIGEEWSRAEYKFVPLVTEQMALRCALDILLLRPEEDRFIFTQGDLDGQVKTLFDALQMPENKEEAGGAGPQEDETPFFCLLHNDRIISEVRVVADQLLLLPHERKVRANDCFAVIHVKLNPKVPATFDRFYSE